MQARTAYLALLVIAAVLTMTAMASAHVSVASGPVFAGSRAVVTLSVGHGCEGADTYQIDVAVPEEITSIRGMRSTFGAADVQVNASDVPTNVVWTKDDVRDADDQYYQMAVRFTVPETPFTVLYLKTTQKCRAADGTEYTTEWAALPGAEPMDGGEAPPPAAPLVIMPPRSQGWNKYTVPREITDLEMFFGDAQIVWAGDSAYSSNEAIADLIEAEDGVEPLTTIAADAEIWVKY